MLSLAYVVSEKDVETHLSGATAKSRLLCILSCELRKENY